MEAPKRKRSPRTTTELENTKKFVKRNYDERGGKYRMAIAYYIKKHPEIVAMEWLTDDEQKTLDKVEQLKTKATRIKAYHNELKLKDF